MSRAPDPAPRRGPSTQDAAVWLSRVASLAVSITICLPLWGGGWLLSGDHAPHIAETIDLAHGTSGWSDLAYAGFPLGVLHSPLWYGLLALLVRLGAPAWATYATAVTLTECTLGLVALEVGRRRAPAGLALLASVGVQTQSLLMTGPSGVLSGMWTFGLAIAMFLVLVDRLHEPFTPTLAGQIAALVGGIGLTHTFAIHAVVAVVAIRCLALLLLGREERRHVAGIVAACIAGAVASAAYWLAATISIDTHDIEPVVSIGWPNFQIFFGPWLDDGFSPLAILAHRTPQLPDLLLLLFAGLAFLRLGRLDARERALFATTVGTMLLILFVVSHVAELRNRAMFGPIPWRIMVISRSLLLFGALAAFPRLRPDGRRALALAAVASLVVMLWAGERTRWLQHETGTSRDPSYEHLHEVFREVARVAPELEGRVYAQNTHAVAGPPLGYGHPLALLSSRAGVRAVGSYYSLVPFAVDRWLTSFVGPITGEIATDATRRIIDERLDDLGCELVVLVDRPTATVMEGWAPAYTRLATTGPFTIFRRPRPGMARSDAADARVERFSYEDGEIQLDVSGAHAAHDVAVAISFAQLWELTEAPPGAYLARRRNGLMRIHLPPGDHHVVARYRAPRWPFAVSLVGWALIVGWLVAVRRSRARSSAQETALATDKAAH